MICTGPAGWQLLCFLDDMLRVLIIFCSVMLIRDP